MKALVCLSLLGSHGLAKGQAVDQAGVSARSFSGQFNVQGQSAPSLPFRLLNLATNGNYVFLEPTLVTVSCERIRQMVLRELGLGNVWQGKVYVSFRPVAGPRDEVFFTASHFADGWCYRLEMPDLVERHKYVLAVVQALLLEFANRQAGDRSAEVPLWLSEGLTHSILNSGEMEIILPPPSMAQGAAPPVEVVSHQKRASALGTVHRAFSETTPLTFEELSWPSRAPADETADLAYRSSSRLFLASLLQLREGRACLRSMLERLPRVYNWQFAFLDAFQGYFSRPLEVEKWWALQTLRFTTRDLAQAWSPEESREKLNEVLRVPVRVYQAAGELPESSEVNLQSVVTAWSAADQKQTLEAKLRQLEMIESRLAPELLPLVQDYRRALSTYLEGPLKGQPLRRGASGSSLKVSGKEMAGRLDTLDRHREGVSPHY